jgi:hypothetical protein
MKLRPATLAPAATLAATLAASLAASAAGAQQANQLGPAVRALGPVVATAAESLAAVSPSVRALSDGRVLVNDPFARRLLLLDQNLKLVSVVADTLNPAANYGPRPSGMIPFRGDSTLFVDAASMSMLVLDPQGKVARVMAVPRSEDAGALMSSAFGGVGFDPAGRFVYRAFPNIRVQRGPGGPGGGAPGAFNFPTPPDTAAIVRVDLATRKVDTLAWIKVPQPKIDVQRDADGRPTSINVVNNPLPQVDDWALLPDGTVAVVRGRDYHVDLIAPDGARSAAAKVPFDWQRLTDEQKVAFIDSVKAARERMANAPQTAVGAQAADQARMMVRGGAGGSPPGAEGGTRVMISMVGPGGEGGPPRREGPGGPATVQTLSSSQTTFVQPSELPDYKPPFLANSTRADLDGNLWVRIQGGYVYDVIDRKGALVDRVRVPANRQIVGFGPGTVYLTGRDNGVTKLEVAKIR